MSKPKVDTDDTDALRARVDELEAELVRARLAASAAFGDLREIAIACEQRDDECYRQAIERRLAELTAKANELPGLTATIDEFGHAIGLLRKWIDSHCVYMEVDGALELKSILNDLPRFPTSEARR